mgnify:FL=1
MGPGFFGGPPPREQNEKLKEAPPKSIGEVPGYIARVTKSFFFRLTYIVRLVWEARKSLLILMVFMAVFNGVSPVLSAFISANLLNKISLLLTNGGSVVSILLPALLLQFGYMFFVSLVNTVSNMITRVSSELVTNYVKVKIMNKAKQIDVSSYDMPEFYEKFENANRESGSRPIQVINATFSIVSTVISAVSFISILAAVAWFAPLIVILLSLPSAIITFYYRKKNFRYMRHRSKDRRQMNYYSDTLVNKDLVKEMRLFNLSDTFIFNYNRVFKNYFKGIKGMIVGEGVWSILSTLVTTSVNCALFFYIASSVASGGGQIGDYSLYTGALTSIASCVAALVSTTSSIYEGTLFIDNMIVFMNEKSHIVPSLPEPRKVTRGEHRIEFEHVGFKYPGGSKNVLTDISFTVEPGDTVVLVGLNGAGKTTLLKLLTRLYDPTEGRILLDGHDIREYDVTDLYSIYGAIFQDFGKYAVTVKENIVFGDISRTADDDGVHRAAVSSAADDFIKNLPEGYDTPLTKYFEYNATELSGGQWQKIAVARAFYAASDILILDEPTASLDAIAEQEIFNQFDRLRRDKISFFVSHRLSSATIATKIIVLEGGRLAETGTHAELMEKKGVYYKLFSTQASRYITEEKERTGALTHETPTSPDRGRTAIPREFSHDGHRSLPGEGQPFPHDSDAQQ